jgi:phosphatidylglycerophosphate synthase
VNHNFWWWLVLLLLGSKRMKSKRSYMKQVEEDKRQAFSWWEKLNSILQIVRLLSFGVSELWIIRDECSSRDFLSNVKHVFHYAMNVKRRFEGLEFVVKDQFKGGDEKV